MVNLYLRYEFQKIRRENKICRAAGKTLRTTENDDRILENRVNDIIPVSELVHDLENISLSTENLQEFLALEVSLERTTANNFVFAFIYLFV